MLRVKSRISLVQLEEKFSELDSLSTEESLGLPKHLSFGGAFGISSALSQYVAKWSRLEQAGHLQFAKTPGTQSEFSEVSSYPHCLISMFMSRRLSDSSGEQDRLKVLRDAAPIVDAMNSYRYKETLKGGGAFLACFSGTRSEFLRPLYEYPTLENGLRSTSDFQILTRDILEASYSGSAREALDSQIECIASVIYELIENTNDHAVRDEFGKLYDFEYPNVRGILAKKIDIRKSGNAQALHSDERTALWTVRDLMTREGGSRSYLEISVFDYGIGIAKTRLLYEGKVASLNDVPFEKEESIVKQAFQLGNTTKAKGGTGVGLDTVVKCLTELGATLRLRTGRICYWQDFSKPTAGFNPLHFIKNKPMLSEAPGTLYTFLIPLKKTVRGS